MIDKERKRREKERWEIGLSSVEEEVEGGRRGGGLVNHLLLALQDTVKVKTTGVAKSVEDQTLIQ